MGKLGPIKKTSVLNFPTSSLRRPKVKIARPGHAVFACGPGGFHPGSFKKWDDWNDSHTSQGRWAATGFTDYLKRFFLTYLANG